MTAEPDNPNLSPTDDRIGLSDRIRARRADEKSFRRTRDSRIQSTATRIALALGLLSGALVTAAFIGKVDHDSDFEASPRASSARVVAEIAPASGKGRVIPVREAIVEPKIFTPRRSYRGFETWQRNAAALPAGDGPLLAIVIDDMGLKPGMTERFSALPVVLTFAFLPYADNLEAQSRKVHSRGHELLLHLPMEPLGNADDPGPQALDIERSTGDLLKRFKWNLDRFDGYVGINNHMGSRYTADFEHMATILGELDRRGLMFLDSLTSASSRGYKIARDMDMAWSVRDVFLDNKREVGAISAQLAEAARIARKRGYAVAIGHPYPQTLQALKQFLNSPQADGVRFAPVSATVRQGASQDANNAWRVRMSELLSGG